MSGYPGNGDMIMLPLTLHRCPTSILHTHRSNLKPVITVLINSLCGRMDEEQLYFFYYNRLPCCSLRADGAERRRTSGTLMRGEKTSSVMKGGRRTAGWIQFNLFQAGKKFFRTWISTIIAAKCSCYMSDPLICAGKCTSFTAVSVSRLSNDSLSSFKGINQMFRRFSRDSPKKIIGFMF